MNIHKYQLDKGSNKCHICLNNFSSNETYAQCEKCEMEFCKNCLKESMINYNSAFSFSGDVFNLQCPNCKNVIKFTTIAELFGKNFYYKELLPKMTDVKSKYLLTEKIKDLSVFISQYSRLYDNIEFDELRDVLIKYSDLSYKVDGRKTRYTVLAGKTYNRIFENYLELKTDMSGEFYLYLLLTFIKIIDESCVIEYVNSHFRIEINISKHIQLMQNIKPYEPKTLIDYLFKQEGTFEEYILDEKNEHKIIEFIDKQPEIYGAEILKRFSQLYSYKNIAPLKCYINDYYEEIYLILYVSLYKEYLKKKTYLLDLYNEPLRSFLRRNISANVVKNGFRAEFKCPSCELGFLDNTYLCNCCHKEFCKECLNALDEDHKCKSSDKASLKMIKETTKPCPKCASRIYRISGCSQMFCTTCHTGFDWVTGEIITSNFHNPHRMEWLNSLGRNRDKSTRYIDSYYDRESREYIDNMIMPLQKLVNYKNHILDEIENSEEKIMEIEFKDMFALLKYKQHFNLIGDDFMQTVRTNIISYNNLSIKNSIYRKLIDMIEELVRKIRKNYYDDDVKLLYCEIQPLLEFIDVDVKNICKMFSIEIVVPEIIDHESRPYQYIMSINEIKGSYKKYSNQYFVKYGILDELQGVSDELTLNFDSSKLVNHADILLHPNKLIKQSVYNWQHYVKKLKENVPIKDDNESDWSYVINCFKKYSEYTSRLQNIINSDYDNPIVFHLGETIVHIVCNGQVDNIRSCLNKLLNYYKEFIGLDLFIWLIAELIIKLYRKIGLKNLVEILFDYIEFCAIMSYERSNLYFFYRTYHVTYYEKKSPVIKYDKEKHSLFAKIAKDVTPLFSINSLYSLF